MSADTVTSGAQVPVVFGQSLFAVAPADLSFIFAGDPKRPGAGYVTWNGVTWRIEGSSAAGSCDWCYPLLPGSYEILDDGHGHDMVHGPVLDAAHIADYFKWVNTWHGYDKP
jgi:hypothetical protein